ncbi:TetR/AcrR family transcriptional regulator [Kamptonema formosum]|uniref:TetR/AcrR family transcriptional regulator n=1 Tax=Kamptonema formosum TaxID=331992 RepID=UPI0003460265|nr:TetR/AcrR family transcriptional regulator [Oscillatoria sp. PCC 10802]
MARAKSTEPKRESAGEKVEQILKGAMQEFLAHGYTGTSMDRVAAAARVSKATVYSHFGDKEGLFAALVERLAKQRFQILFNAEPPAGEAKIVLPQLAATLLNQVIEDTEYLTFMRVIVAESGRFPNLAKIFIRHITQPVLEKLVHYLASHPELNIPDPEAAARIFLGALVQFVLIQEILHGKEIMPLDKERIIDSLTYFMLSGAGK